jgi:hypothetical protein
MKRSLLPFMLCSVIAAQAALADDLLPAPPSPSQPAAQLPAQSPSNEYVMSDDPNFNPNGKVNGNWTSLQPVRPQP